jgi:hypothetical protein
MDFEVLVFTVVAMVGAIAHPNSRHERLKKTPFQTLQV